jgi:hypothetical protein
LPGLDPLRHPIVFSAPRRLTHVAAWQEHMPFGMYLVDLLRPATIVELGTHYGDSYCAFCQAVAELRLSTAAYAVDTWTGDEQSGLYGEEVLRDLRAHHDPLYGGFSELVQSTFDDALPRFQDGTVDLLHIDGCHRYEVARHDFDSWLPKLSPRGVVLLHDTCRRLDDFGVWRLLDELRERYPCFELTHSSGLALVLAGAEPQEELVELTRLEGDELTAFRSFFATLGSGVRALGAAQRSELEQVRLRRLLEQAEQAAAAMAARHDAVARELTGRVSELERESRELQALVTQLYESRILRLGRRLRPGPKQ